MISVEYIVYDESVSIISLTMKTSDTFTTVSDVYINNSFEESGIFKEAHQDIISKGEEDNASSCIQPSLVPPAWRSVIRDQELLCVVNPHWLQFDPPSHLSHTVLASVYSVLMTIGFLGNGLVIYLYFSCRSLRTPSNIFILNLAISDFLMVGIVSACVYNSLQEGPAIGKIGCDIYGFTGGITGTTSIMTLAAISFDRYLVISFPLDPFKKLSSRQVLGIVVLTWVYSGIFSIIPLTGLEGITYSPEGYLTTCSFDYLSEAMRARVYIFLFCVAAWVLPLYIITFSYLSIVSTVAQQERQYNSYKGSFANSFRHRSIKRKKNTEIQLAKMACGIIGLWVAAWTPYSVVALLGIFSQKDAITPLVSMVPALFCKTAACFDPYVYALSHPRFKNELKKRLLPWCRRFHLNLRNDTHQGCSVSTFSEIKEDLELSDAQGWETTDPSLPSLGPLLQKSASYPSNPILSNTRHIRASISSPGSRSLISPTLVEIYPRSNISAYSFRSSSHSLNLKNVLEKGRKLVDPMSKMHTTAITELQTGGMTMLPFPYNSSFGNGVEELSRRFQSPATMWSSSQDGAFCAKVNTTGAQSGKEMQRYNLIEDRKTDYKNYLAMTLMSIPTDTSTCRPDARSMASSNSLPNMDHGLGNNREEKLSKNVFMQIFYGKIRPTGSKNKSHSSLFQDEK